MENYIVTIYAKEEHADEVGEYYKELHERGHEYEPNF